MDHHEEKTLAQYSAEAITKNLKTEWRYDYSAKMASTDIKGKGADGVGGGDAPGMKLAEPKGEEGKPDVKKVKHSCVTKVEHPEWGAGNCLSGEHTLTEDGTVTHYDIMFEHGLEKSVPVESFEVVKEVVHEHTARPDQAQDEVNTELPAGPHGTTFVEPAIKSEGKKSYTKKGSEKEQIKRNEVVGEGVGAALKIAAKGAAKGAIKGAKAGAAKGAVSGAAGALKGKKESRSFKDFRSISEKKQ